MSEFRFCTSCQVTRPIEGGVLRQTKSSPRWICKPCVEKKSMSIYQSQRPTSPADFERLRMFLRRMA